MNKIKNHRYILKYPILKQFAKFCLVGFFNTLVDFSVYLFLTRIFLVYFIAANIFSFLVAVSFSFILNKYWTFRNQVNKIKSQYFKFFIINVIGLGINTSLLYFLVVYFHLSDLLAKALAIGIVLFWNFGLNKLWTFRPGKGIIIE
jgi:putative flippase GtrA